METDGQSLYAVLTTNEVGEKMTREINQISEVFLLSKSDATLILISLRWNSFKASDRLGDDKEKLLSDLGLVKVFSSCQENDSVSSFAGQENLVSTPFCSHKFSETCWRSHLSNLLTEEEERVVLCPNPDCVAPVGPDTIEKLTEPAVKMMYNRYVLGSFVEANKESIKWCPAPGCEYAIELHEDLLEDDDLDFGVVCLCGHTFCWSCTLESHRPVTCKEASVWSSSTLDTLKSNAWLLENTKRCPNCNCHVQRTDDPVLRMITCICSCSFCWRCLLSEEEHNGNWNCVELLFQLSMKQVDDSSYLRLWETCLEEYENSKSDLKAIEENGVPRLTDNSSFNEQDVDAVKEATLLMVQCRLVLKWSCAYEYFIAMYQSPKTQYVKHLRGEARKTLLRHKATQEELMNKALTSGYFSSFKVELSNSSTITGNYFHEYVKTLESGFPEIQMLPLGEPPLATLQTQDRFEERDGPEYLRLKHLNSNTRHLTANQKTSTRGREEPSVSFTARDRHRHDIYHPRADLITEDTQQKHTTSSHFTSLHPQLHHHRSSLTDNVTDLEADHKTKERRERSSPSLILRELQLVTCSTGEPKNPHNSRLIKDLTHG
uniref:RBR-type E3 ubiquitin transferase n=1 Tax=Brassica campestris TaxID=3711 RepID=M4FB10_BRACM